MSVRVVRMRSERPVRQDHGPGPRGPGVHLSQTTAEFVVLHIKYIYTKSITEIPAQRVIYFHILALNNNKLESVLVRRKSAYTVVLAVLLYGRLEWTALAEPMSCGRMQTLEHGKVPARMRIGCHASLLQTTARGITSGD
eukprot:8199823-Pyramimonas_sp.AAC.1